MIINRSIKKSISLDLTVLLFGVIISLLVMRLGGELLGGIIAMLVLVLVAMYLSKMELTHPFTWFVPLFYLYSTSLPILIILGERPYVSHLDVTLFAEWLALLTFIITMGIPKKQIYNFKSKSLLNLKVISTALYAISLILTLVYMSYVFGTGLTSKYDIASNNSIFRNLVPFYSIYILSFTILLAYYLHIQKTIPKKLILLSIVYTFLALIILGERDYFLRIILGIVFLYHVLYQHISKKLIITIGTLVILSIPLLGNFKNIAFGSRTINQDSSIFNDILGGEFISASRNLQNLISNEDILWTRFYGETFWWDIQVIFSQGKSPGAWFNEVFFPHLVNVGGGNGFTLVGEGYMNFGMLGVILVFIFLGLLMKFLYSKTHTSVLWLTIYIISIPIFVYAIRADLATLLSQLSKHILLPVLVIYITKHIVQGTVNFKKKNMDYKQKV